MQRVLYLFLSLFIFFAPVPPVLAGTATAFSDQFADLKSHPWGAAELTMMVQLGIMQGYPEGDRLYALPDKQVNRAEFAALLARTLSLGDGQEIPPFTDWQAVPDWARGPAAALYEAGIVTGVPRPDGALNFLPQAPVCRSEIAAMLTRAVEDEMLQDPVNPFGDVRPGDWYYESVLKAYKLGLVNGRAAGRFEPDGTASRVEVMVMLSRFLEKDTANLPEDSVLKSVVREFSELTGKALNGAGREAMPDYLTGEAALAFQNGGLGLWESVPAGGKIELTHPGGAPLVEFKSSYLARVKYRTRVDVTAALSGETGKPGPAGLTVDERYYLYNEAGAWKIYALDLVWSSRGEGE
ncbi:MAG TPA: S-layer homology domain-containing protein [Bacillota bacterium]|jgi:hypothetical protein|nr:S-layer homology domain-containing protein [Peptococcaceae bacterium]HPZ43174.1 S-layer homology domain-containing protein [Bacillota bacterium]HQD75725.1 S-layer homology domain-containing protein [Bacillota bacterium]HUM58581.1 S-layer homology domain-containing protein [Bacillota bacterium]